MNYRASARDGFTLIEILVMLAILAVLAGTLIPVLSNRVGRSDATRLVGDLNNVRTGAEAFVVDVKRYPGDIEDLVRSLAATDSSLALAPYPSGLSSSWSGPYIDTRLDEGDSIGTGFGAYLWDDFKEEAVETSGPKYLTMHIGGIATVDCGTVDQQMDDGSATAGRIRCLSTDSLVYYALPTGN